MPLTPAVRPHVAQSSVAAMPIRTPPNVALSGVNDAVMPLCSGAAAALALEGRAGARQVFVEPDGPGLFERNPLGRSIPVLERELHAQRGEKQRCEEGERRQ